VAREGDNWFSNREARERMLERTERAVAITAEVVLGEAQRWAPVLTGTLRGSGVVLDGPDAVVEGSTPVAVEKIVAFPIVYAAVQEVREDYEHPHGGKAHYLGDSVKAHVPYLLQVVTMVAHGDNPGFAKGG
jgi:hypothetical protein